MPFSLYFNKQFRTKKTREAKRVKTIYLFLLFLRFKISSFKYQWLKSFAPVKRLE